MLRMLPARFARLHLRATKALDRLLIAHGGQAFAEYAVMLSLLVLVLITALASFGQSVSQFLVEAACVVSLRGGC